MKLILSNKIVWYLEKIYRSFILFLPCILLGIFLVDYYSKILTDSYSLELFKRVHDGVKMAATMAALGFYAGYMTTATDKKPKFYQNGERLFHGTALLLVASMLQNFLLNHGKLNFPDFLMTPMLVVLKGCLLVFITYATFCFMAGLTGFLKVLHGENEELLRSYQKEVKA